MSGGRAPGFPGLARAPARPGARTSSRAAPATGGPRPRAAGPSAASRRGAAFFSADMGGLRLVWPPEPGELRDLLLGALVLALILAVGYMAIALFTSRRGAPASAAPAGPAGAAASSSAS